jgi:DNA-binding transcriptional ArsR family regulator
MPDCVEPGSGRLAAEAAARLEPKLQHALNHPIRREVLRRLNGSGEACTAVQLAAGMEPVELSQVSYHLQVLVRSGVAASDGAGPFSESPSYMDTVLDAEALALLRETEEWDREQREAAARGVGVLQGGQGGE